MQSSRGAAAEIGFCRTSRLVRFGRVDVGDPEFDPVHPERVSIDNTMRAAPDVAEAEQRRGLWS